MKILCAIDLLPKSKFAIHRAGMLAVQLGEDLSLLRVVCPKEPEQMPEPDMQHVSWELKFRVARVLWG